MNPVVLRNSPTVDVNSWGLRFKNEGSRQEDWERWTEFLRVTTLETTTFSTGVFKDIDLWVVETRQRSDRLLDLHFSYKVYDCPTPTRIGDISSRERTLASIGRRECRGSCVTEPLRPVNHGEEGSDGAHTDTGRDVDTRCTNQVNE